MDNAEEQYLKIKEANAKGYALAQAGDGVNIGASGSSTRRGRVGEKSVNTLTTQQEMGVVTNNLRIRRLTPKEFLRLQGFDEPIKDDDGNIVGWDDSFYEKAVAAAVSMSQIYKQAGNAVSCNITYVIALVVKNIEEMESEE